MIYAPVYRFCRVYSSFLSFFPGAITLCYLLTWLTSVVWTRYSFEERSVFNEENDKKNVKRSARLANEIETCD